MSYTSFDTKVISAVAVGAITLCLLQASYFIKSTFFVPNKHVADVPCKCRSEDGYKESVTAYVFDGPGAGISGSQFSTKLAMYLRLAGIPHKIKLAQFEKAPKGKTPYIEHDGATFGDTQLIIRYLENTFDLSKMAANVAKENGTTHAFVPFYALAPQDQAMSDLIRLMCEGELYWAAGLIRWGGEFGIGQDEKHWRTTCEMYFKMIPAFIRGILTSMIRVSFLRDAWGQGLVRHSPNDQLYLAQRALKSLSTILGKKMFLLGESPSECDCCAFGCLEACLEDALWPSALSEYVRNECPNLVEYVTRVRALAFPDVLPSDLRPASKESCIPYPRK